MEYLKLKVRIQNTHNGFIFSSVEDDAGRSLFVTEATINFTKENGGLLILTLPMFMHDVQVTGDTK